MTKRTHIPFYGSPTKSSSPDPKSGSRSSNSATTSTSSGSSSAEPQHNAAFAAAAASSCPTLQRPPILGMPQKSTGDLPQLQASTSSTGSAEDLSSAAQQQQSPPRPNPHFSPFPRGMMMQTQTQQQQQQLPQGQAHMLPMTKEEIDAAARAAVDRFFPDTKKIDDDFKQFALMCCRIALTSRPNNHLIPLAPHYQQCRTAPLGVDAFRNRTSEWFYIAYCYALHKLLVEMKLSVALYPSQQFYDQVIAPLYNEKQAQYNRYAHMMKEKQRLQQQQGEASTTANDNDDQQDQQQQQQQPVRLNLGGLHKDCTTQEIVSVLYLAGNGFVPLNVEMHCNAHNDDANSAVIIAENKQVADQLVDRIDRRVLLDEFFFIVAETQEQLEVMDLHCSLLKLHDDLRRQDRPYQALNLVIAPQTTTSPQDHDDDEAGPKNNSGNSNSSSSTSSQKCNQEQQQQQQRSLPHMFHEGSAQPLCSVCAASAATAQNSNDTLNVYIRQQMFHFDKNETFIPTHASHMKRVTDGCAKFLDSNMRGRWPKAASEGRAPRACDAHLDQAAGAKEMRDWEVTVWVPLQRDLRDGRKIIKSEIGERNRREQERREYYRQQQQLQQQQQREHELWLQQQREHELWLQQQHQQHQQQFHNYQHAHYPQQHHQQQQQSYYSHQQQQPQRYVRRGGGRGRY